MPTQLERDLHRNADERLSKWITDTIMRCDVVDLPKDQTIAIISSCLLHHLIHIWEQLGVKPADAGRTVAEVFRDWQEHDRRRQKRCKDAT